MTPCKVCGRPSTTTHKGRHSSDTCSAECGVEAWAATWATTPDQRRCAAWSMRRRRAEARGEPFTEVAPLDAAGREFLLMLATYPNLKALWEKLK